MKEEVQTEPVQPYFAQFVRDAETKGGIGWDMGRAGGDPGARMVLVTYPEGKMSLVEVTMTKDAVTVSDAKAKAKPVKRQMTADERVVVPLLAMVRYAPATWDKRFAREIQYALKDGLITEGQSGQVWRLFWRYRRQIVCADKERLLEMAERLKTPELREVRS